MNPCLHRAGAAALLAAALSGCASLNQVNADVSSYSQWPAARKPASYVYERLPSQQQNAQQHDELETAARKALSAAGFSPAADAASADVSVQLSTRAVRYERYPYGDPFWRWNLGFGYPYSRFGWGVGATFPIGGSPSTYEREVSVLMRDRRSGQVLYESRAVSNDYIGDAARLEAMFEAALKDFPQPAVNPRRVTVQLPQAK